MRLLWFGNVFCNPPYGPELRLWVVKASEEVSNGNAQTIMMLLPARTDTLIAYASHNIFFTYIVSTATVGWTMFRRMPEQKKNISVVLGPKYALRISDLGAEHLLEITCVACNHTATLDTARLLERHPPYLRLCKLEHTLRCSQCGSNTANRWMVVQRPKE